MATYVYSCLFEDLKVKMPFTPFKCMALRALNATPTQLHPNNWGFIRGFEFLCQALKMNSKVSIFFSFFRILGKRKGAWTSFTNAKGKRLITPFILPYKGFKPKFFRAGGNASCPEMFIGSKRRVRGLYASWQSEPYSITSVNEKYLPITYKEAINFLEKFAPMSYKELIEMEDDEETLFQFPHKS